jgi:hypothetical protein
MQPCSPVNIYGLWAEFIEFFFREYEDEMEQYASTSFSHASLRHIVNEYLRGEQGNEFIYYTDTTIVT